MDFRADAHVSGRGSGVHCGSRDTARNSVRGMDHPSAAHHSVADLLYSIVCLHAGNDFCSNDVSGA